MILMALGSMIGWGAWFLVLFTINPFEAGLIGYLMFYLSATVALIGTLSLLGFVGRLWILHHEEIVLRQVTVAFRQACLFAFLILGSLFLQSKQMLAWWNVLIFVGFLAILELLALSLRRSR